MDTLAENFQRIWDSSSSWSGYFSDYGIFEEMIKQIIVVFFAVLLISGCVSANSTEPTPLTEFEAETQDREILEGNTEIKIPDQATEIYGHIDGFQDIDAEVRFIMNSEDLDEFLNSTSCILPLLADDVRNTFQNQLERSWWKPANALKFKWCHGENEHLNQNILIDMTDSDKYIVYVMTQTK